MPHHEVLLRLDAMDLDRGACSGIVFFTILRRCKGSWASWILLTDDGIDLNQALVSYGLDFLRKKDYKKIQPPFFINKDWMGKMAQLEQFDEELYKVRSIVFRISILLVSVSLSGHYLERRKVPYCYL